MPERFAEVERRYQLVRRAIEKHGKQECERILQPKGRAGWVSLKKLEDLANA